MGKRLQKGNFSLGSTFQQWVGSYHVDSVEWGTEFSPLDINSDGTVLVAGQLVDFSFDAGQSSISISRFNLKQGQATLSVVNITINLTYEDARAKFDGSVTAGQSGPTSLTGYQSKREITIPEFCSDVKMSMAIHNDHLHVVGAARTDIYRTHVVVHRKFPLQRLIPEGGDKTKWTSAALGNLEHWSKELWQPEVWKEIGSKFGWSTDFDKRFPERFKTLGIQPLTHWASSPQDESDKVTNADITSLVSIGGSLFCFYTYSDTAKLSLRARQFTAKQGDIGGQWGPEIVLYEPQGDHGNKPEIFHTGAVSAVAFGKTQILVSACGTGDERVGGTSGPGYGKLMFYLFDIGNVNGVADGKGWAAESKRWIDINQDVDFYLQDKKWSLENRSGAGYTIDADWVLSATPAGKGPGEAEDPEQLVPNYYLAINFGISTSDPGRNQHGEFTWQSHIQLEVDDSEVDSPEEIKLKTNPWGSGRITAFSNQDGKRSSLKRDASGRLQSLQYFRQKSFSPIYTRTDQAPTTANQWGRVYPTDKVDYYGTDDHTKPINIFYAYSAGKTDVETPGETKNGGTTLFPATAYPILEFVCYGVDKIQLHDYGSIRMVSDKREIEQRNPAKPVYQIGGYFDGPVPFPLQNFAGYTETNGTKQVAGFEYGNSDTIGTASSTESTWNVGMEAEGKTTKGVGIGFKASYEYEDITKDEKEVASENETVVTIDAVVNGLKPGHKHEAEGSGTASVLSTQFYISGFQFVNRWGEITSDGLSKEPSQSPKLGRVLARAQPYPSQGLASFEATMVTPGDLESYTAEAIDEKMGQKNYVRDTICRNAYVFGDGKGGQPFLMYTWSGGNMSLQSSHQMKKSFTSHEWSHGGEAYAGLTGGVGAEIFGVGAEFEFSVMAGGGYKREWSEDALSEAQWTIGTESSEMHIPTPISLADGGDPDGVIEYSFRAYFLPVPTSPSKLPANQWAKELRDMLPKEREGDFSFTQEQVDTGFGCWRIFFLVTSIKYRQGSSKIDYQLPRDLDNVASVYSQVE